MPANRGPPARATRSRRPNDVLAHHAPPSLMSLPVETLTGIVNELDCRDEQAFVVALAQANNHVADQVLAGYTMLSMFTIGSMIRPEALSVVPARDYPGLLAKMPSLTQIDMRGVSSTMGGEDMKRLLASLPRTVQRLTTGPCFTSPTSADRIPLFYARDYASPWDCRPGAGPLWGLGGLTTLSIQDVKLSFHFLDGLARWVGATPSLTRLYLECCHLKPPRDDAYVPVGLADCTSLQSLTIDVTGGEIAKLPIARFLDRLPPNLATLTMKVNLLKVATVYEPGEIKARLPRGLTELVVDDTAASLMDLAGGACPSSLTNLALHAARPGEAILRPPIPPTIETLCLREDVLGVDAIQGLCQELTQNLTRLSLIMCLMDDESLRELAEHHHRFPNLSDLNISMGDYFTDEGLRHIAKITSLETLDASYQSRTSIETTVYLIANMPRLTSIIGPPCAELDLEWSEKDGCHMMKEGDIEMVEAGTGFTRRDGTLYVGSAGHYYDFCVVRVTRGG